MLSDRVSGGNAVMPFPWRISRLVLIFLLVLYSVGHAHAMNADRVLPAAGLAFDRGNGALVTLYADRVHRSTDGGRHWTRLELPPIPPSAHLASIAVSAASPAAIYVAGPRLGVLRSTDNGRTWTPRNNGLPGDRTIALATHAADANTVYAYVTGHGIYRSQDGGLNWKMMDAGPPGFATFVHTNMSGSMQGGWLFVATARGVQRAMDCFCGWRDAGGLNRAVRAVTYDPRSPQNVYAATDNGLSLSTDGGERWSSVKAPAAEIGALVATADGMLYAADGKGALFASRDEGRTWKQVNAPTSAH